MKKILYTLLLLGLIPNTILAQIIPDSSLGAESSRVESEGDRDTIKGGATRDNNLFHSFEEFNIKAGRKADFTPSDNIENIFSRVTGNNISKIDEILGVSGNANLYFMNPNGIIFGKNSQLNINGSFFATTADSILFNNNTEFSAVNPDASPLLIIDIPIGLKFRDNPGSINSQNNAILEVKANKNLSLIGGNVFLTNSKLQAFGGNIELASISGSETIAISPNGSLMFSENIARGNIFLDEKFIADVRGDGNGFITINANNLKMTNESHLFAGIQKNMGSSEAISGDIIIKSNNISLDNSIIANQILESGRGDAGNINLIARNSLLLKNNSHLLSQVKTNARGNAGNIRIESSQIALNNSTVDVNTEGIGRAGNINLIARDSLMLDNESKLLSEVKASSTGNAGNIKLESSTLKLDNNSRIIVNTEGIGNAGNIDIRSENTFILDNSSLFSNVKNNAIGNGGIIKIVTDFLAIKDSSQIQTNTEGIGHAGNINLIVDDSLLLDNKSDLLSQVKINARGNAGNIKIESSQIALDNSTVDVNTEGIGRAGNINLIARDSLLLDNESKLLSEITAGSTGNAGNIKLESSTLKLDNNSRIIVNTEGIGNAGNIDITTNNSFALNDGSQLLSQVSKRAEGNGGVININANSLTMQNRSFIESNTDGMGAAGDIVINVIDRVSLTQESEIRSNILEKGIGNGGSITIDTKYLDLDNSKIIATTDRKLNTDLSLERKSSEIKLFIDKNFTLRNQSLVSVEATNNGDGGNIEIEAEFIIAYPSQLFGNDIRADADIGKGGNIILKTNRVFGLQPRVETEGKQDNLNDIDASSEFNISGQIAIEQPDVNFESDLAESNPEIIDASKLITHNVCQQITNSKFVNIGKGGLPKNPHETLTGITIDIGLVTPVITSEEVAPNNKESLAAIPPKINQETPKLPARGWIHRENGMVQLVSYSPNSLRERNLQHNFRGCAPDQNI